MKFYHHNHQINHQNTSRCYKIVFLKNFNRKNQTNSIWNFTESKLLFNKWCFSIFYSYVSILETIGRFYIPPLQTSRHATVIHNLNLFSQFPDSFREALTDSETSLIIKGDLQGYLAWLTIDYFELNLSIISQARKNFRPQTNDDLILADEVDHVWNPEWSHV